jgi:hypothetical protein
MGLQGWLTTNSFTSAKFGNNNPFNIIYVADYRTNSGTLTAVRLVNGVNLPAAGLTVATPNPMYIQGIYNCPNSAYLGTTNTTQSAPASVACDALTILSPAWQDLPQNYTVYTTNITTSHGHPTGTNVTHTTVTSLLAQQATSDTVNTAIIAGIVASTGTSSSSYSGGANNLPRLLEDWGNGSSSGANADLTLNTSIVCLFNSTWATGPFVLPGQYYYAPMHRNFSFDLNYTQSAKMPPGTPNICRMVRAAWCNPPPGNISFAPSPTLDFVPR